MASLSILLSEEGHKHTVALFMETSRTGRLQLGIIIYNHYADKQFLLYSTNIDGENHNALVKTAHLLEEPTLSSVLRARGVRLSEMITGLRMG